VKWRNEIPKKFSRNSYVVKVMSDKKLDVVVLGAGIVGVSAAYAVRQQGLSVVLVDRREPGS
jgi:glycerol-3-phosphate dehydrogenase